MPSSPALRGIGAAAAALAFLVLTAPALAAPAVRLGVDFAPGSPAPPVPDMAYRYALDVGNPGDVALDGLIVVDTVPFEMTVLGVTTGSSTGLVDFAAGEGVRVSYEKNTALGVFTLWGSSPNTSTSTTLTAPPPGLGAGEYITRVRWKFGQAAPGMTPSVAPTIAGRIQNPDHAGGFTRIGDPIVNCATVAGLWTAGPQTVGATRCLSFDLPDAPTVTIDAPDSTPLGTGTRATATLTGGDPTGSVSIRVYRADDPTCGHPIFVDDVDLHGVGSYDSANFTAAEAGAYKWLAHYGGDLLHNDADSGCANPAGAFAVVAPPVASASFDVPEITAGQSARLTYTIANPGANTVALTGVALRAQLPAGLAVATPSGSSGDCGGAIAAAPGSHSVALTGGTIPAGGTCSFDVHVTAAAAGALTATTEPVESANGGAGNAATASLIVRPPAPADPTPPRPVLPRVLTAPELAVSCSPDQLVLSSVRVAGRRVRFHGLAAPGDAGQQLLIRALPNGKVAARATVLADGSFAGTAPLPRRRAVHRTRYVAELGERRSADLKLTRRLTARLTAGAVLRGHVTPPLDTPTRPVVVRRLTSCAGGYEVVARVKPGAGGRFRVALPATSGPALYRVQTRVRTKVGGAIQTFGLVLAR